MNRESLHPTLISFLKALTDDQLRMAMAYGAVIGLNGKCLGINFGDPYNRITSESFDIGALKIEPTQEFFDGDLDPPLEEDDEDGIYPDRITDTAVAQERQFLIEIAVDSPTWQEALELRQD